MINFKKLVLLFSLAILISGGVTFTKNTPPVKKSYFGIDENSSLKVENILSRMSIEEKCGQLIIPYAYGKDSNPKSRDVKRLVKLIENYHIGGIMFMKGDIDNQAEITNYLQKKSKYPLLISADYERGPGMRLDDGVEFPFNMAVAAANDTRLTYLMGKYTALESRALGVHQNYAPIVDINHDPLNPIINTRAYSDDKEVISNQATAYIQGLSAGKMIATAKHFPGHGATDLDSHNELPLINLSENEFYMSDLVPFRNLVNFGVKSVMVGHLEVPAYESRPGIPATLSKNVITGVLKNELGFDGLIITDALNMQAVTKHFSAGEAAVEAVKAGNDLLLFPADEEGTFNGLVNAVKKGDIPVERLNESVRKILSAKSWLGLLEGKGVYADASDAHKIMKDASHWRLAEEIAEKSITLLRDRNNYLPLEPLNYYETAVINLLDHRSKWDDSKKLPFEEKVQEIFGPVNSYYLNLRSKDSEFNRALSAALSADLVILPVYVNVKTYRGDISLDSRFVDLINEIKDIQKPVLVVSIGNPYIISSLPEIPFYMCTFGNSDVSQYAAANSLTGRIPLRGVLPVSIPKADYFIGDGLVKEPAGLWEQKINSDSNYNFSELDKLMNGAVKDKVFPGGVLLVGHRNRIVYNKAFGRFTYDKNSPEVTTNSVFDLASVSKVLGTTSAAMILYQEGLLELDYPVKNYLPEFGRNGKESITIRNLLTHTSGLPAFRPFHTEGVDSAGIIDFIMNCSPDFAPGSDFIYSDLGMITMQKVIEKITGMPLNRFLKIRVFDKLQMYNTFYNPAPELRKNIVPTEVDNYWRHRLVQGTVHDETADILGGVAGHAGLFSTSGDIAKLLYLYVNKGSNGKTDIFRKNVVELFTTPQNDFSTRALGWDTKSTEGYSSAGSKFSDNSFGHTGFTGTSVWVDKDRGLFVVLLTNRVHPTRENGKIGQFRPQIHNAVIDAVTYPDDDQN